MYYMYVCTYTHTHTHIYGFLVCRYARSLGLAARQNTPFFLQGLLDDAYPGQFEVANLGLSGATASDGTNKPYRNGKYWPQLQALAFDVAIVTLRRH